MISLQTFFKCAFVKYLSHDNNHHEHNTTVDYKTVWIFNRFWLNQKLELSIVFKIFHFLKHFVDDKLLDYA